MDVLMSRVAAPRPASLARLWKTQDVADYLGMSARQVRKLVVAGRLHAVRIDHHLRFDRAEVDELIEQATRAGVGAAADQCVGGPPNRSSTNRALLTPISI